MEGWHFWNTSIVLSLGAVKGYAFELQRQFIEIGDQARLLWTSASMTYFLFTLPFEYQEQHQEFRDATSVDGMWSRFHFYWDFIHYSLLEHVIKTCCKDLIANMEEYKKKLELFLCNTRLCVFAERYKMLNIKEALKPKKWEQCTLQDLENWKKGLTFSLCWHLFAHAGSHFTLYKS